MSLATSDSDRAHEPRGAAVNAALAQQFLDLRELDRIVGAVPARRVHARCVVERRNLQPGIVGHADQAGRLRVVARLQPGVLGKRDARLFRLRHRARSFSVSRVERHTCEDAGDLLELPGIGGGDEQSRTFSRAPAASANPLMHGCRRRFRAGGRPARESPRRPAPADRRALAARTAGPPRCPGLR